LDETVSSTAPQSVALTVTEGAIYRTLDLMRDHHGYPQIRIGGTANGDGDEEVHGDEQDGDPAQGHAEAQE
jgi:hypothetical protein